MADDELVLAHRNSEWTGHAPILEEDIAFSNIAQDELGHAGIWYDLLQKLGGAEADSLVFFRDSVDFRNVQMVELPKGDWAFSMLRQYLFDAYELVLLASMTESTYKPLAEAAAKIRPEELYHYRHTSMWVQRLGRGTEESARRSQQALDELWPFTGQLFELQRGEELLVEEAVIPNPAQIRRGWMELVEPIVKQAALILPRREIERPSSRDAHTEHLTELLGDLQQVARLDPEAQW